MRAPAQSSHHYFMVTSQGASATRWLTFVLASNPAVFAAHGHFPIDSVTSGRFQKETSAGDSHSLTLGNAARELYEAHGIEEVFGAYRATKPEASVYGNIHSYTLEELMGRREKGLDHISQFVVANVVRHPVSYVESHSSLVGKAERHPDVYKSYADDMFPKALREFRELFLLDCPDFREFLAFAVSCYSALYVARDLGYEEVRHFRMEALTSDADTLAAFCRALTGLDYDRAELRFFIESGAINRHRESSRSTDPRALCRAWPAWKRDVAAVMFSETALARFERVGYEIDMLRERVDTAEPARDAAPSLYDRLEAMDGKHPYLALLEQGAGATHDAGPSSQPRLVASEAGYNIVEFEHEFFVVSQGLGEVNVAEGARTLIERHGDDQISVVATLDEARKRIRQRAGAAQQAGYAHLPRLVDTLFGFNIVHYLRNFFALKQNLGEVDLAADIATLSKRYSSKEVIVADTLESARTQVRGLVKKDDVPE